MVLGLIFTILTLPFRFFGLLSALASLGVGIVYPTLESFKAIESKELGDDRQWLSYWVVVTTALILEKLLWPVLMWVPLYSLIRVVALAWLALPQFQGAKLAYDALRPLLFAAVEKSREVPALEPYLRNYQKAFSGKVSGARAVSATGATPAASAATGPAPVATPAAERGPAPAAYAMPDFEALKKEAVSKVAETFEKAKEATAAAGPAEEQEPSAYQPLKAHAQ